MPRPLLVGTDYSGMETPLLALRALRVKHRHLFSSDVCPKALSVIEEKFQPEVIFTDALKRDPADLPPRLDLYVAGFPCQVFSSINQLTGNHRSPTDPLKHFRACVEAIKACRPTVFILENVPGLITSKGGRHFASIESTLNRLQPYEVHYLILNARDYGSPQNRERLFMVGFREGTPRGATLPPPKKAAKSFEDILERDAERQIPSPTKQKVLDACARQYRTPVFMVPNLVHMSFHGSVEPSCLTRNGRGLYWSKRKILTTLREDMRLQGIPDTFSFPENISVSAGRQLVGNAMSVDVLKCLLREVLKSC
jgi:site-specific DNA-cytosine methylase